MSSNTDSSEAPTHAGGPLQHPHPTITRSANNWYGREIGKTIGDNRGLTPDRISRVYEVIEDFVRAGRACTVEGSVDRAGQPAFSDVGRCGG